MDVDEATNIRVDKKKAHDIDVVIFAFDPTAQYSKMHIEQLAKKALDYGNGFITLINNETGDERSLSQSFMCGNCGISLPKPEPRLFSFNSPFGACLECTGLGEKLVLEADLVIPNKRLTFDEGAVRPWTKIAGNQTSYVRMLEKVAKKHRISLSTPVEKMAKSKLEKQFVYLKQIPLEMNPMGIIMKINNIKLIVTSHHSNMVDGLSHF